MKIFGWQWLALAVGTTAVSALALGRPLVEVGFTLAEPVYRAAFRTDPEPATGVSELQIFETNVARAVEAVLASRVGFLRFGPGTNTWRLLCAVDRQPVGDPHTQLVPTRFSFQLLLPSRNIARLDWEFRPVQEYINPVVPERFLNEITNRLAARLEADLASAITSLFSQIPLANEIYLLVLPPMILCVLPFSYDEIEAGQDTGFEFETQRQGPVAIDQHHGARGVLAPPDGLTNLPPLFARGILAVEDERVVRFGRNRLRFPHTRLAELNSTNALVRGRGLYVTDYVRVPASSLGGNTPSTFRFEP